MGVNAAGDEEGSLIMTLHIVAVQDYWVWVIRNAVGSIVEESTIRFRSAATAELRGQTRIRQFEVRA